MWLSQLLSCCVKVWRCCDAASMITAMFGYFMLSLFCICCCWYGVEFSTGIQFVLFPSFWCWHCFVVRIELFDGSQFHHSLLPALHDGFPDALGMKVILNHSTQNQALFFVFLFILFREAQSYYTIWVLVFDWAIEYFFIPQIFQFDFVSAFLPFPSVHGDFNSIQCAALITQSLTLQFLLVSVRLPWQLCRHGCLESCARLHDTECPNVAPLCASCRWMLLSTWSRCS